VRLAVAARCLSTRKSRDKSRDARYVWLYGHDVSRVTNVLRDGSISVYERISYRDAVATDKRETRTENKTNG